MSELFQFLGLLALLIGNAGDEQVWHLLTTTPEGWLILALVVVVVAYIALSLAIVADSGWRLLRWLGIAAFDVGRKLFGHPA